MGRNRPRPPSAQGGSRQGLSSLETAETSSAEGPSVSDSAVPTRRQRGERVEAPSKELLAAPKTDWGKIGVWVTLGLAGAGVIWNFAYTTSVVNTLVEDVRDLKRKADDFLKFSSEAGARLNQLEQKPQASVQAVEPAASLPSRRKSAP